MRRRSRVRPEVGNSGLRRFRLSGDLFCRVALLLATPDIDLDSVMTLEATSKQRR